MATNNFFTLRCEKLQITIKNVNITFVLVLVHVIKQVYVIVALIRSFRHITQTIVFINILLNIWHKQNNVINWSSTYEENIVHITVHYLIQCSENLVVRMATNLDGKGEACAWFCIIEVMKLGSFIVIHLWALSNCFAATFTLLYIWVLFEGWGMFQLQ